jgi:predicted metal-dependent phosphoesterase TrpH
LKVKIDLHVHTCYSYDGLTKPEELVFYSRKVGLDGLAITDHDRVDKALKIAKETRDYLVIPGVEISSLNGHVIGLNVQEAISKGLPIEETVERIHEQGGLTIACHPISIFKANINQVLFHKFDAVEVINSSAIPFKLCVRKAMEITVRIGKPQVAGSDAHYGPEIGSAYTLVDSEMECDKILKAINNGRCQPYGKAIPMKIRLKREILKLKRRL